MRASPAWNRAQRFATPHAVALACLALLIAVLAGVITHAMGDTHATLLVSQQIVQHGEIKLDTHASTELKSYPSVYRKNGHYYDLFPLGTPLLSVPFVAVASLFGIDATAHGNAVQAVIVATVLIAELLLLYAMARLFVGRAPSVVLAALCVFGTSLVSTGLSTLYSHDFAVLAATAAIYLAVRSVRMETRTPVVAIAVCLFLAYLCRPTLSLLAPFLLLYLFVDRRWPAVACGLCLAALLGCFALWSRHEFSQWLPDYYMPQRLDGSHFHFAAVQNLFGPSRGLFVFSPFLFLALPLALWLAPRHRGYLRTLLIGLGWPIAHWLAVSRFPHWWAGWSFGPRLMMDCLPGLFLLLFHSMKELQRGRRLVWACIAVLGTFSVYVHSFDAFANPFAALWNIDPNVDEHSEYVSDWRYPQFLYNPALHSKRLAEFKSRVEFASDAPNAQFIGFSASAGGFRWAGSGRSSLHVPLADAAQMQNRLVFGGVVAGTHRLRIFVNGQPVYDGPVSGSRLRIPARFDPGLLRDGDNTIEFEIDGPANARHLLGFHSLSFYPKAPSR